MTAKVFFDTNILVYAATGTGKEEPKRKRAMVLIESEDFGASAQVLQEFFVTVVRKASVPLSAHQAMKWIEQFTVFRARPSTTGWFESQSNTRNDMQYPIGTRRS
jgi:predicted nucleic acid-binding protein